MKIIEPSAIIISPGTNQEGKTALRCIESMARISHKSEDKQIEDSWERFIQAVVISRGDWSVVEHQHASVLFRVDRGISHELVRHRLFSFTQESTRFVNGRKTYPEGLEFIKPENIQKPSPAYFSWLYACEAAERTYLDMLEWGTRSQEARSILPNSLASTIAVTGNLRVWRSFFLARVTKETHPDFRAVTIPLLKEFQERIPILYSDIEPLARQIDNLKKPR
jgi:thymidylate synthase (FAD)